MICSPLVLTLVIINFIVPEMNAELLETQKRNNRVGNHSQNAWHYAPKGSPRSKAHHIRYGTDHSVGFHHLESS